MHIHKNTFYYRLNAIKEIIGSDLTDGQEKYRYLLSFNILQFTGDFKIPGI